MPMNIAPDALTPPLLQPSNTCAFPAETGGENFMSKTDFIHSQSRSNVTSPCEHCLGTVDHEPWCVIRDPKVQYAYAIVNDPCALTYRDSLILHSLGVTWRSKAR
jgi:hypothetical protein